MKTGLKLLVPFLAFLISCNEKEQKPSIPEGISIKTENIGISKGATALLDFNVSPSTATFNYNVGTLKCEISLKMIEDANGKYDGRNPLNYKLSSVNKENKSDGRYTATIKDMGRRDSYTEKAVLEIVTEESGVVRSEPFIVRRSGTELLSMKLEKDKNPKCLYEDIEFDVSQDKITISSPFISNPKLVMSFETNGSKVTVNDVEQVSGKTVNDFSVPVKYKVHSGSGTTKEYIVSVIYSGLPVLFIDTPKGDGKIPDKHSEWLKSSITLYNTDWTINHEGTTGIRGRGNSTWSYPKKPYALKLDDKVQILGMPKHNRWVLLANWMDRTMLRNRVAFAVAMKTDLEWTPNGEFVELVLDGNHMGTYYLCEHIKVHENRVNIDELDDTETDGGYMMELDTYYDEINKFKSQYFNLPYMFKDPDEVNSAQANFLKNYVNTMEASLKDNAKFAARDYTNYIDIDSFIDWWLVHEITGNEEPKHPKSSYMHKDKGGKFHMGPVWDFDWGSFMPHTRFVILNRPDGMKCIYYDRLFQDREFKKKVKERWNMHEAGFREITEYIQSEADRIRNSESMNHAMWPIREDVIGYYPNGDETMTFDQAVARMKSAYSGKLEWMDKTISNW